MAFRRSHKKSRAGCLECKRRHIKCDEGRPVCRLCSMAEREMYCSYGPRKTSTASAARTTTPPERNTVYSATTIPTLRTTPSHGTTSITANIDVNMVGGLPDPTNHTLVPVRAVPQAVVPTPSCISSSSISSNPTADSSSSSMSLLVPPQQPSQNTPGSSSSSHETVLTPSSSSTPDLTASVSTSSSSPLSLPGVALNLDHIELIVHMMRTKGMFNLGVNVGNYHKQIAIGFEYALKAPYLIHQFMAYSARHLAHLHPDRYGHYTRQADTHQAQAIQIFNQTLLSPATAASNSSSASSPSSTHSHNHHNPINQSNCVAVVLFSSVLGQTLIAETFDARLHPSFVHPDGDLDAFLRSYTQCLNTFRGVFVIASSAWPLLLNTPLAGYLLYSREFNEQTPRGHHCDLLLDLLNTTYKMGKMSGTEHQVCLQMARYLQVGFDAILSASASESSRTTTTTTTPPSNNTPSESHVAANSIPIDPRLDSLDPPPTINDNDIPKKQPYNHNPIPHPTSPNPNATFLGLASGGIYSQRPYYMCLAVAEPPAPVSMSLSLADLETDPTDAEMTRLNRSLNRYQMLSAFSMLCPAEFARMLETKRPEALVILGYYALLLYYGRHMWQVGDAGRVILGMVDGYLGTQWRGWLRGPVGVIFHGHGEGPGYIHT